MISLAVLVLFLLAALSLLVAIRFASNLSLRNDPQVRQVAIYRVFGFFLATPFLAAAGGLFHHIDKPVSQIHGFIRSAQITVTRRRREDWTEIIVAPDDVREVGLQPGQMLGLAANGIDKRFRPGEYATVHYIPGGEILDAQFRDPAGQPDGGFHSNAVLQPYFPLVCGLISLVVGLRAPGAGKTRMSIELDSSQLPD